MHTILGGLRDGRKPNISLSFRCGIIKRHTSISKYVGFAASVKLTNNGKAPPTTPPVANPPNLPDKLKLKLKSLFMITQSE